MSGQECYTLPIPYGKRVHIEQFLIVFALNILFQVYIIEYVSQYYLLSVFKLYELIWAAVGMIMNFLSFNIEISFVTC